MVVTSLCSMTGAPLLGNKDLFMTSGERFAHIQVEMHHRALPMSAFAYSPERQIAAGKRMKLAPNLLAWLIEFATGRT